MTDFVQYPFFLWWVTTPQENIPVETELGKLALGRVEYTKRKLNVGREQPLTNIKGDGASRKETTDDGVDFHTLRESTQPPVSMTTR